MNQIKPVRWTLNLEDASGEFEVTLSASVSPPYRGRRASLFDPPEEDEPATVEDLCVEAGSEKRLKAFCPNWRRTAERTAIELAETADSDARDEADCARADRWKDER